MEMEWSREELLKLKENLHSKWKETLALEFGVSEKRIANMMTGDRINSTVVIRAVKLAEQYKKEVEAAKETLAAL